MFKILLQTKQVEKQQKNSPKLQRVKVPGVPFLSGAQKPFRAPKVGQKKYAMWFQIFQKKKA